MGILSIVTDKFRSKAPEKVFEAPSAPKSADERHFEAWNRLDRAIKSAPTPTEWIKAKEQEEARIAKDTPDFFKRIEAEAKAYDNLAQRAEKAAQYVALEKDLQRRDKAAGKNQDRTQDMGR